MTKVELVNEILDDHGGTDREREYELLMRMTMRDLLRYYRPGWK